MSYLVAVLVGAFVGWNMPQPQVMKDLQAKFMVWFNKKSA